MNKVVNTVRAVIMFTLLLFILIFCFQNTQDIAISFLKMRIESMPLFVALFGTLATGLLIGYLAGMISGTKSKREALRTKEDARELKERPQTSTDEKTNTQA